jgi:hypothetical protein
MAYAEDLKSFVERHVGSSPTQSTEKNMAFYINTAGKILAASAAVGVATGNGKVVTRGCLTGLLVWFCWAGLVLSVLYYLVFE